jgi:hypothetical protein
MFSLKYLVFVVKKSIKKMHILNAIFVGLFEINY